MASRATDWRQLRGTIARIEGRPPDHSGRSPVDRSATMPVAGPAAFGVAGIDALFDREFPSAALHDIAVSSVRDGGLAAGFVAALLARIGGRRHGAVLWAIDGHAAGESGVLYGPGLVQFGVDPGRLIVVRSHTLRDIFWALEEGLAAKGLIAAVGEVAGDPKTVDFTATRRLALRSARQQMPVFLVRVGGEGGTVSAARTRWLIRPAASRGSGEGSGFLGWPAWRVAVVRNRDGRCGEAALGYDGQTRCFFPVDGDGPDAIAAPGVPATGRSSRSGGDGTGRVVAFRRGTRR